MKAFLDWAVAIRDVLFARGCAGCDRPDEVLCPACSGMLTLDGSRALPGRSSSACLFCAEYTGDVRRAILSWKDHGDVECKSVFAGAMGKRFIRWLSSSDEGLASGSGCRVVFVPVPSSPTSIRRRGGWHMGSLSAALVDVLHAAGVDAATVPALRLGRGVTRSVESRGLRSRVRRIENELAVDEACGSVLRDEVGAHAVVCLMDDIITTGETMRQCVRALQAVGVDVGVGLVLARTPSSRDRRHTM
ncbi:ComF family protein [uncultured Bifidobacterium sp.]|uniref:ComF family protein n=1 Tax=uncultured Bifidobacterium sp. TaxID=165187 RepID=UPI00260E1587|nr:ComF family protein [uncultured Bifidobacterium sp.]